MHERGRSLRPRARCVRPLSLGMRSVFVAPEIPPPWDPWERRRLGGFEAPTFAPRKRRRGRRRSQESCCDKTLAGRQLLHRTTASQESKSPLHGIPGNAAGSAAFEAPTFAPRKRRRGRRRSRFLPCSSLETAPWPRRASRSKSTCFQRAIWRRRLKTVPSNSGDFWAIGVSSPSLSCVDSGIVGDLTRHLRDCPGELHRTSVPIS